MERDLNFEIAVGERVREFRKRLGWSQQVLGDYANLERNQIRRIEQAKNSTSLAVITSIAKALGRQPHELLKTDYHLKVNKTIDSPLQRRRITTTYIRDILNTSFLNHPKQVDEIVRFCEQRFDVSIKSSPASGVLKKLVDEGLLIRTPAKIKGRYCYQRPGL